MASVVLTANPFPPSAQQTLMRFPCPLMFLTATIPSKAKLMSPCDMKAHELAMSYVALLIFWSSSPLLRFLCFDIGRALTQTFFEKKIG